MTFSTSSRRDFLRVATACTAGLGVSGLGVGIALGDEKARPGSANDRLGIGVIGTGGMGSGHLGWLIEQPDLEVRAVCDVDSSHLAGALETVANRHGKGNCQGFKDFRELLAKPGIDAVWVTTPDHWHALVSIAAIAAGKDVYCEKPLTNSVGEGIALRDAVKNSDRILQCGSHERSNHDVRFACELVRNGRLGKIHTIRINLPCEEDHHQQARSRSGKKLVPTKIPAEFDYDFWLGHTPNIPFADYRCHFWWRFNTQFGGGEMTDRGAHVIDIAQLALGMDGSGPVEYRAKGTPLPGELYNAYLDFEFENIYPNGIRMIGQSSGTRGLKIEGEDGWIFIHIHGGKLEADPVSLLDEKIGENEIHLGRTNDHKRNFLEAVRSRNKEPFAHVEVGHRTATLCHLNNLAMKLGRTLKWDPIAEKILGDDEAQSLLSPKMRSPWTLG